MEERNRVQKWETGSGPVASCQKPGQMNPAHQLASRPDVFGQNLTRPFRSDPGRFCTVWPCLLCKTGTEKDEGGRIRHMRSGPILAARWP